MGSVDIYSWTSRNWKERQKELEMMREIKEFEENYKETVFTNENLYISKDIRLTHRKIGEVGISSRGQKMKIVGYRTTCDIDVLFEDGTLVEHKQYHDFQNGKIRNPNYNGPIKRMEELHLGETTIANNGQKMKIIKYNNTKDITVEFEDGTTVEKISYGCFKKGSVKNPNILTKRPNNKIKEYGNVRIGETRTATNGQKMTIIAYRSARDLDVQFEDGGIAKNKMYSAFKSGRIANPNNIIKKPSRSSKDKYLGKEILTNKGIKVKIVGYHSSYDVDVELEDGTVVEHVWGNVLITKGYLCKRK